MTRRFLDMVAGAILAGLVLVAGASAGPLAGKRVVVVTTRDDLTGAKHQRTYTLGDDDRLYVTRRETEVVHTATGTSTEDVYPGRFRFGNVTVSRVQH